MALATLGALAALATPMEAVASTAQRSGSILLYNAGAGEANVVQIARQANGTWTVSDTGAVIAASAGCTQQGGGSATCGTGVTKIELELADRNDRATVTSPSATRAAMSGGSGDDALTGGDGADDLNGGEGGDTLRAGAGSDEGAVGGGGLTPGLEGGPGNDSLYGGDGEDALDGGPGTDYENGGAGSDTFQQSGGDGQPQVGTNPNGSDFMVGSTGSDTVDYSHRKVGVTVTLGTGLDGASGEKDTVGTSIEDAVGGWGSDRLTGSNADNDLIGGARPSSGGSNTPAATSNDVLNGLGGEDRLLGSMGRDTMSGDVGDDLLGPGISGVSEDGGDSLSGGAGTDKATYEGTRAALTITLDGAANDGRSGVPASNVKSDVEDVTGSTYGDTLIGSDARNRLDGGGVADFDIGHDVLKGGRGGDTLDGSRGNDTLDGGSGGDTFIGGDGTDLADYSARSGRLSISLDDQANDGSPAIRLVSAAAVPGPIPLSEGDDVRRTVENVTGGAGDDTIAGSTVANQLRGLGGADTLSGSTGSDTLVGGSGADSLSGGPDPDVLNSVDRAIDPTIDCGFPAGGSAGSDSAFVDLGKDSPQNCEQVTFPIRIGLR